VYRADPSVCLETSAKEPSHLKSDSTLADDCLKACIGGMEAKMATTGIASSGFFGYGDVLSEAQKLQADFKQLGTDLKSGSLSAAQADLTTLNQDAAVFSPSSGAQGNSPIDKEFQQLTQDLKGGNLSAAQQDYANIQQALQGTSGANPPAPPISLSSPGSTPSTQVTNGGGGPGAIPGQSGPDGSHRGWGEWRHNGGQNHGGPRAGGSAGEFGQLLGQLGQALQSGNWTAAQQAYSALSQDWGQTNQGTNSPQGGTSNGQAAQPPSSQPGSSSPSPGDLTIINYISISISA
jgi:hypothetical protein